MAAIVRVRRAVHGNVVCPACLRHTTQGTWMWLYLATHWMNGGRVCEHCYAETRKGWQEVRYEGLDRPEWMT